MEYLRHKVAVEVSWRREMMLLGGSDVVLPDQVRLLSDDGHEITAVDDIASMTQIRATLDEAGHARASFEFELAYFLH